MYPAKQAWDYVHSDLNVISSNPGLLDTEQTHNYKAVIHHKRRNIHFQRLSTSELKAALGSRPLHDKLDVA